MQKSKPAPKCSDKERHARISQCLQWLNEGYTRGMSVRKGSEIWGVSTRQVDDYYSEAQKLLTARFKRDITSLAGDIAEKLDYIYEKATTPIYIEDPDSGEVEAKVELSVARQAIMDKAKLAGLLKDEIELTDTKAPDLSDIPKEFILAKLRKNT